MGEEGEKREREPITVWKVRVG